MRDWRTPLTQIQDYLTMTRTAFAQAEPATMKVPLTELIATANQLLLEVEQEIADQNLRPSN